MPDHKEIRLAEVYYARARADRDAAFSLVELADQSLADARERFLSAVVRRREAQRAYMAARDRLVAFAGQDVSPMADLLKAKPDA